jgi:hypothetical protein
MIVYTSKAVLAQIAQIEAKTGGKISQSQVYKAAIDKIAKMLDNGEDISAFITITKPVTGKTEL